MKKSGYDQEWTASWRNGTLPELAKIFATCEGGSALLERIETNADTFIYFRMLPSHIVEQASIRDCKKGLFARVWTAEIWLNNNLRDGQLRILSNKIETVKAEQADKADI